MCLSKNLQPAVAHALGYGDRSPSKRIEKFMRDLYTHMRNIFLITRTLEQRMALIAPQRKADFRCAAGCQKENASRKSLTASNSSTAKFTPRPTAFSAIRRAGSCAFFFTRSNGG